MSIYKNILILVLLIISLSCSKEKSITDKTIVTGLSPIASIIKAIVREKYQVFTIIPNTVDPHYFNLKPSDTVLLAKADLVIALDKHFDGDILTLEDNKDRFYLLNTYLENDDDHQQDKFNNPHLWVSYRYTEEIAYKITGILSKNFPQDQKIFEENNNQFINTLQQSYQQIKQLKKENNKKIMVVQRHYLWNYLLEELDISLLGTLEEFEGDQASLKKVVELINKINQESDKENIILIDDTFSEPSSILKQISKETGVPIKKFNPMISPQGKSNIIDILDSYSKILI